LCWRDNQIVFLILWFVLFEPMQIAPAQGISCRTGSPLVLEKQKLTGLRNGRELVLWMCGAEKHDQDFDPEAYTCPDKRRDISTAAARRCR